MKKANLGAGLLDLRQSTGGHGGNVYAFARSRHLSLMQVLDCSASINPLGCPRGVAQVYHQAFAHIVHYPEPYAETLTRALAQYHDLDQRTVLTGNGSTQLLYALARLIAPRRALILAPAFSEHAAALRQSGTRVDHFVLRPPTFALSFTRLQRALARGYEVLVLVNPNSPTGILLSRQEREQVVRLCQQMQTRLIVDETFVDWVEEDSLKHQAAQRSDLIVLRSMTKFFALPGLRVGYLIAHPRLIARLRAHIEPWSVNSVAQAVACASLEDAPFRQKSRVFMERERLWLFNQLASTPGLRPVPSQTNFFLLHITQARLSAAEVTQRLAAENILVRNCDNFVGLGKRFFRTAIRTRKENLLLMQSLRTIFRSASDE